MKGARRPELVWETATYVVAKNPDRKTQKAVLLDLIKKILPDRKVCKCVDVRRNVGHVASSTITGFRDYPFTTGNPKERLHTLRRSAPDHPPTYPPRIILRFSSTKWVFLGRQDRREPMCRQASTETHNVPYPS
jgi:hypothetical protein